MAIWVDDYHLPYQTHNRYDVHLNDRCIHTLVTHTPYLVKQWIANIPPQQRIVGLDVEWRPNFRPNQPNNNPVAILQLCVGNRCLIFQIIHAPFVPYSLSNFLRKRNYTFVGVGIERDVQKLVRDYNLNVVNHVDLSVLAAERRRMPGYRNAGIRTLAMALLGMEIEKPKKVTMSRWDADELSDAQVQYACLDAFLSHEIGRVLNASAPPAPHRRQH